MASNRAVEEDVDLGEWEDAHKDPDSGKQVRYRIRRIPATFERFLRARFGRQVTLRLKRKGDKELDLNMDTETEKTLERAVYALTDTENYSIVMGGPKTAEVYGRLLGKPVADEEEVTLDGNWSKEELKRFYLTREPDLASDIEKRARKKSSQHTAEEDELGEI